jgi:hypothetical protein
VSIRQLKSGEVLPEGQPRRYVANHGYVRLRWRVGPREYVETYEHRVDGDYVTTAEHVHHRNHRRDDNAPENLEPLTSQTHWERHASAKADRCIEFYREGYGTVAIGRIVGLDGSSVYRLLQRRRVIQPRKVRAAIYTTPLPSDEQLREWHAAGVRVGPMVEMAGVCRKRLEARLGELGLPRFPPGNPLLRAAM